MIPLEPPPTLLIEPMVRAALLEDFGRAGDITSAAVIPADAAARFDFVAREAGTLAGLPFAALAFALVDPHLAFTAHAPDGARVSPGDRLATVEGPARAILGAERVALNFLGHLSGIATATRAIADAIAHTRARIVCTRKTTPLLRIAEKYAVRAGGGVNHRFGLDDGLLVKDNHIAVAGGVAEAVRRARAAAGHMVMIEVEVETLAQLDEALEAGAHAVLLDNMDLETLRAAVARIAGTAVAEASGRVRLETAAAIAETGVDLLSSGAITHSAPTLDIGLDEA